MLKTEKVIGIIWLIFSLLYLYLGFEYLYTYSTLGMLWAFMIPIIIAYTKIVCGILILGFIPYLLSEATTYSFYKFLH